MSGLGQALQQLRREGFVGESEVQNILVLRGCPAEVAKSPTTVRQLVRAGALEQRSSYRLARSNMQVNIPFQVFRVQSSILLDEWVRAVRLQCVELSLLASAELKKL